MADLVSAVDALDRLIAATAGVAAESDLVAASEVARRIRRRRGFLGESVVVALVGGTGSGKSSLLNAIAGEVIAETGAQRPVTTEPLAWIPANPEPGLVRLLDDIGITAISGHDRQMALAVIDLPDIDSIEFEHRAVVNRLLPQVDALVWVMDPEKYADRTLHRDHIRPLADYSDQFVFVLNQIDRVSSSDLDKMVADLKANLSEGGIDDPTIVTVAADPPAGPAIGIDELLTEIAGLGAARVLLDNKLKTDCRRAAQSLAAAAGISGGGSTGFRDTWARTSESAARGGAAQIMNNWKTDLERHGRNSGRSAVAIFRQSTDRTQPGLATGGAEVVMAVAARSALEGTASVVGEQAKKRLAAIDVETEVGRAAKSVLATWTAGEIDLPGSLVALRWLRRAGVIVIALAMAWAFDTGTYLGPVAVAIGGLAAITLPAGYAGRAGIVAARDLMKTETARLGKSLEGELDRRVGRPAREVLRERAEAVAALVEFELIMAALD